MGTTTTLLWHGHLAHVRLEKISQLQIGRDNHPTTFSAECNGVDVSYRGYDDFQIVWKISSRGLSTRRYVCAPKKSRCACNRFAGSRSERYAS